MHYYQIRPKITLKNSIQYQLNLDCFLKRVQRRAKGIHFKVFFIRLLIKKIKIIQKGYSKTTLRLRFQNRRTKEIQLWLLLCSYSLYSAQKGKPLENGKACTVHYIQVLWESEGSQGKIQQYATFIFKFLYQVV